jgi:hypothetical protein
MPIAVEVLYACSVHMIASLIFANSFSPRLEPRRVSELTLFAIPMTPNLLAQRHRKNPCIFGRAAIVSPLHDTLCILPATVT